MSKRRSVIASLWTVAKRLLVAAVIVCVVLYAIMQVAAKQAENSQEALDELGLAENTPYSVELIGIRGLQAGVSGDFFLGTGDISGLETVLVVVFAISIGDADYIMNVSLDDVTFQQEDGARTTAMFDLGHRPYAEYSDTLDDVLERNFEGLEITLSPKEFNRLIEEMP